MANIVIFGIETEIGQNIFKRLNEDEQIKFDISVPMQKYSPSIEIPANQIFIDFDSDLGKQLDELSSSFDIIINCSPKIKIPNKAELNNKIIDMNEKSINEIIYEKSINEKTNKGEFKICEYLSNETLLYYLFAEDAAELPEYDNSFGHYVINTKSCENIKSCIGFTNVFFAYLFWFLSNVMFLIFSAIGLLLGFINKNEMLDNFLKMKNVYISEKYIFITPKSKGSKPKSDLVLYKKDIMELIMNQTKQKILEKLQK